jgi:hypothetical protein
MSTCAHCGIVRVHIALFFQCLTRGNEIRGNVTRVYKIRGNATRRNVAWENEIQ